MLTAFQGEHTLCERASHRAIQIKTEFNRSRNEKTPECKQTGLPASSYLLVTDFQCFCQKQQQEIGPSFSVAFRVHSDKVRQGFTAHTKEITRFRQSTKKTHKHFITCTVCPLVVYLVFNQNAFPWPSFQSYAALITQMCLSDVSFTVVVTDA